MKNRFDYKEVSKEVFDLMIDNEKYIHSSSLEPKLLELVKIRASQINGCGFCLDMHTRDARKLGESEERIFMLSAWRETDLYTDKEQAALVLTEIVTEISSNHLSDKVYKEIRKHFSERDFLDLIFSINNINNWNRLNIVLTERVVPEIY